MNRSHSIHLSLTVLISVVVLPILAGQTVPGRTPSVSSQTRQIAPYRGQVARCLEELDVLACKRARKLPLTAREKSQVLTYEFVAQPPGSTTTALDKAIALDPQNAIAQFLRGMVSTDYEGGLTSYLKAIELNPEWKRYYVDAALLADNDPNSKSSEQVLTLWRMALENAPDDPRAYAGYGNALKSRGRIAEAEAVFQKGLAANPLDAQPASELCSLNIEQKNVEKLRATCRIAVRFSAAPLENLAWQLEQVKEYALAELAYRKALERGIDPQNTLKLNLAAVLMRGGKASEAAEIYKDYLAKHPSEAQWRDAYATALESMGDLEGAEDQYVEAVEENDNCQTHGDLGLFYLHQKKYQQALDQFDQAFQDQWDCPTPVFALTEEKQAFGPEQQKVTPFEERMLARVHPKEDEKTANTWYRFAKLAHDFHRNDQAAVAYRRAADLSPTQAFPLGGLGWALYDAGRYQEAIVAFEEAEKRQPGYLKSAPEVEKRYQESIAAAKGQKK